MTATSRYGHRGRRSHGGGISNGNASTGATASSLRTSADGKTAAGAHSTTTTQSTTISSSSTSSSSSSSTSASSQQPKNPKLYKTEMCRSWVDNGYCNYGNRCQYAHGEHEKRPISRHPKYKTAYCQSYHQSGYCPYGPRCHFVHNEDVTNGAANSTTKTNTFNFSNTISPVNVSQNLVFSINPATASPINGILTTATTTAPHCIGSTGDSPVPSSAGSGIESPLASTSPSLDLDDNASSLSANSWTATFAANHPHTNASSGTYFSWPSVVPYNGVEMFGGSTVPNSAPTSYESSWNFTNYTNDLDSVGLINDFLGWNLDDIAISSSSSHSSTPDEKQPRTRLPVFAQLSNASSSASS